jgi:hypothetical protein
MKEEKLHPNEIRDYLTRAPKRWAYNGFGMVNNTFVRLKWLTGIACGTLHEKINRRAGIVFEYKPWKYPVGSSIRRNHRNNLRKRGLKYFGLHR